MSTATGYCMYDLTLGRFYGDVHRTAKAAEDAAPATPEGHEVEPRKV